jgi:hypothetical protein
VYCPLCDGETIRDLLLRATIEEEPQDVNFALGDPQPLPNLKPGGTIIGQFGGIWRSRRFF